MKKIFAALLFALLAFPAITSALSFQAIGYDWRPYLGLGVKGSVASIGIQVPKDGPGTNIYVWNRTTAIGAVTEIFAGVKHNRVRIELNYFNRASINDVLSWLGGVVSASAEAGVIANFYYDYVSADWFALYIGGGAGFSSWVQNTTYPYLGNKYSYDRDGVSFAWNILTGMSFTIADAVSLDFGLGYQNTRVIDLRAFDFKFGLRYTF